MHSWTVVGYAYKADIYCGACVVAEVCKDNDEDQPGTWSWECDLEVIAEVMGLLDNEYGELDETTYDSDEFPKVIFADQDEGEHCNKCHEALIEHDCPEECYYNGLTYEEAM